MKTTVLAQLVLPDARPSFQPIGPVRLERGKVYGLSVQTPENEFLPVRTRGWKGRVAEPGTGFHCSAYVDYLGTFAIFNRTNWSADVEPRLAFGNADFLTLGAWFQFYVVPSVRLTSTSTNTLVISWSTQVSGDKGFLQTGPTLNGPWSNLSNAISVSPDGKETVVPLPQASTYYRLAVEE